MKYCKQQIWNDLSQKFGSVDFKAQVHKALPSPWGTNTPDFTTLYIDWWLIAKTVICLSLDWKLQEFFLLSCFSFFVQAAQGQLFLRQTKEERRNKAFKKLLDRISLGTNKGTRARMMFSCLETDLKINRTDHKKKTPQIFIWESNLRSGRPLVTLVLKSPKYKNMHSIFNLKNRHRRPTDTFHHYWFVKAVNHHIDD